MIPRRRREVRPLEPRRKVNPMLLELQTAKEILAEIFHARPADVEEMIRSRLKERSWTVEQTPLREDGMWPATFCPGE